MAFIGVLGAILSVFGQLSRLSDTPNKASGLAFLAGGLVGAVFGFVFVVFSAAAFGYVIGGLLGGLIGLVRLPWLPKLPRS